ncbi:hypothetical protein JMJ56_32145 [Belnapia sp. T18]|uniref:DUF962 domain-containing protein n=1 Tax=Belnapia arida TaxID=2804533 RepID=A0ABS1UD72_9PROT|nr:hypothetical protein [Belnapia arida]MBL6082618.1 hypothetical protein [Belnapia arida]
MTAFIEHLREQRWDDHRYYHHSRINQSLHLVSAVSFVCAYIMAFWNPAMAALIGWLGAMTTRQVGHLVFEPKGYDAKNQATHEHKENIKVGYNLRRKIVLMSIWVMSPFCLLIDNTLGGTMDTPQSLDEFIRNVGILWLCLAMGGLLFRTMQLFFSSGIQTGLVWATKIITDPFHDIMLYRTAPLHLLRGELIDQSTRHNHSSQLS